MISDRALSAMRASAAVASSLPQVRVRISSSTSTLLDVQRPPVPTDAEHPVVPVCAFRRAVVRAHRERQAGQRLRFMGLDGVEPMVSYGVRPHLDEVLPGGMLRLTHEGRWLHLAALPIAVVEDDPAIDPIETDGFEVRIALHVDADLDVSILHVATDRHDRVRSGAAVEALAIASGRLLVAELEAHLAPTFGDVPSQVAR